MARWSEEQRAGLRRPVEAAAREGRTATYGELARQLGLPVRGPHWKALLDDMSLNRPAGTPDITVLVVNKATGLPGQLDFVRIDATEGVEARVQARQAVVFAFYRDR